MKLTLSKCDAMYEALDALVNRSGISIPIKVWYRLGRNMDALSPIILRYSESKNQLLRKYGKQTKLDNPLYFEVPIEDIGPYTQEYKILAEQSEEIPLVFVNLSELATAISNINPQALLPIIEAGE